MTVPRCGERCLAERPADAYPLSASTRREAAWVSGDRVVRAIAEGGHAPGHPFATREPGPTLAERAALLARVQVAQIANVQPLTRVCGCSFESPFQPGRPLQDYALGPDAEALVPPQERRLEWAPGQIEGLLAQLVDGLLGLHAIGIAHGDPGLLNAFVVEVDGEPRAVWIDLNSLLPGSATAQAMDAAAFVHTCLWPALLDAGTHSPALYAELVEALSRDAAPLPAIAGALRMARSDRQAGGGRETLVAALQACDLLRPDLQASLLRTVAAAMAPLYFLDQTRADHNTRFYRAVLTAERARHQLLEEERTRLAAEADRRVAAAEERAAAAEARVPIQAAESSEALRLAAERASQAEDQAHVLRGQLAAREVFIQDLLASTSWRLSAPVRWVGRSLRSTVASVRPGTPSWRTLRALFRSLPISASRKQRLLDASIRRGFLEPARPWLAPESPATVAAEERELAAWPADRPLVSIVIPCFNYGRFVAEAVDSVLRQTFKDFEILVVDGGSDDPASLAALRQVQRPKTTIHFREGRHLVGDNRNYGIERARGKYICCLDADDMLLPTYLEKALYLLETQGVDVVSTSYQRFGEDSSVYPLIERPTLADMIAGNQVATCAVFPRELWERAGGFQDTGLGADYVYEDWRLWMRFAALGARIYNIAREPLFGYRVHPRSLTRCDSSLRAPDQHRAAILAFNADVIDDAALARSERARTETVEVAEPLINLLRGKDEDQRPTILIAAPFLLVGGAERLLSSVTAALHAQGYRVAIVTSVHYEPAFGDSSDWFTQSTDEIYHLPRFLTPSQWRQFAFYLLARKRVSLLWIVGSAFFYDLLPDIRERFPDLRVIDQLFNTVGHTANNRKHCASIDLNLVESREVERWLLDAGERPERIRVVPSGVDLEAHRPQPRSPARRAALGVAADAFVVGFSGRLAEEKRPEAFLAIANRCRADLRMSFLMTGGGPLADDVRRDVARLDMGDRLRFLGIVDDVRDCLGVYDALVLPSRLDGRPVVVLESLAMGVPVIASRVGALPEIIRHGENGFLCDPNDLDAFVYHLKWLVDHPEEHARMRQTARRLAEEELAAERMQGHFLAAVRKLLDRGGAVGPAMPDSAEDLAGDRFGVELRHAAE